MHKCKYSKTDYITHFIVIAVFYMSWHQGAIIREFINIKVLLVQHVFQALSALTSIIKVKRFKCQNFRIFNISLTVHLGIILVNNQLDALFSLYLFISLLYMFRATQWSSSASSFLAGIPGSHLHRVIYARWCFDTFRFSWWWALGCSRHVEKGNK
jgi:hypothetical protein